MNSSFRLQGVDLAKENYALLQQVDPKAKLHVDDFGKLYAQQKSESVFGGIFSNRGAKADGKEVERARLNAQVWGHLIPGIKELQAKERLSEIDAGLIQGMIDEIAQLRENHPQFIDRMKELLSKMSKQLDEQACRYLKQSPAEEEPSFVDVNRMEEVLEELRKLRELVYEGSQPQPAPKLTDAQAAADINPKEKSDAENKPSKGPFIGSVLYNGAGIAASLAVGAVQAGINLGSLPFRAIKGAAGVLLAPDLVQRSLGLSNFKNAFDELVKSKVWIPARVGGKTGVTYTGPLTVDRVLPGFQQPDLEPRPVNRGDLPPVSIRVPDIQIRTSLEGIDWERNPLLNRLKSAGSELVIGSAKMAFWALALYYLVGRFANENEMCSGECDPESPTIISSMRDYASELWNQRADWEKCDRLLARDLDMRNLAEESFQNYRKADYCDGIPSDQIDQIAEQKKYCNSLEQMHTNGIKMLQDRAREYGESLNCNNPNRDTSSCEALQEISLMDLNAKELAYQDLKKEKCNIPQMNPDGCKQKKESYEEEKNALANEFRKRWAANFCDDEKPERILENLFADMKKNPSKYPMNFARSIDAALETAAEAASIFKEPAKATLRGFVGIGNYLREENPMAGVYFLEAAALLGVIGNFELKARASTNYLSSTGYRALQLAAIIGCYWINTFNSKAGTLYNDAINFNATEAFGL